jgi:hypothetical protein
MLAEDIVLRLAGQRQGVKSRLLLANTARSPCAIIVARNEDARSQTLEPRPQISCRVGPQCPTHQRKERPIMKDQETVQKFIELRAQRVSFARIAGQLNVAKPTLIEWSRQHQHLIQNLRPIEWEEFADTVLASRKERFRALAERLRKFEEELARRELASVPTASLHAMTESLRRCLEREAGPITFTTAVDNVPEADVHNEVQDWEP